MSTLNRRRSKGRPVLLALLLLVGAAIISPAALALARGAPIWSNYQWLGNVFAADDDAIAAPAPGKVRVPVSGRVIPAYTKIGRDEVWSSTRQDWAFTDVDESLVESAGILVSVADIVGRVSARDKRPGYVFTEADLMPKGTRPGFSAGIPPGKRALRVEVDRVGGIIGLQPGDRFDIVSSISIENPRNTTNFNWSGPYTGAMQPAAMGTYQKKARVRALVQNGVVVTPLQTRQVPLTSSSLTSGPTTRNITVQEMVIAMDPHEVAPFMEAISIDADLQCLARSGHPDDPLESLTPSSEPVDLGWQGLMSGMRPGPMGPNTGSPGEMSIIESIDEGGRVLVPVPNSVTPASHP